MSIHRTEEVRSGSALVRSFWQSMSSCWEAILMVFFCSSRRRHTRSYGDWSSDVCSSDLRVAGGAAEHGQNRAPEVHRVHLGEHAALGAEHLTRVGPSLPCGFPRAHLF